MIRRTAICLSASCLALAGSASGAVVHMPDITIQSLVHQVTANATSTTISDHVQLSSPAVNGSTTIPTFASGDTIVQRITAPAGEVFVGTPTYAGPTNLQVEAAWDQVGTALVLVYQVPTSVSFESYTGAALLPAQYYGSLSATGASRVYVDSLGYLSAPTAGAHNFTFSAIDISVIAGSSSTNGLNTTLETLRFDFNAVITGAGQSTADQTLLALAPVPEPASLSFLIVGSLLAVRRRPPV